MPQLGGGTLDLKWWGGANDFLGLEIHDFGIFLGKKILASIFGGSLILVGMLPYLVLQMWYTRTKR